MSKKETIRTLNRLFRICKASERGYNTVANVVRNTGLKVLLKTFAQQRRQMAAELRTEIEALGGKVSKQRSFRGMVHRGRIIIVTTLTIGPEGSESTALKEAMIGEKAALKTYQNALSKDLNPEIKNLIQSQFEQIQETSREVSRLRGLPGDQLVVRLFNSEHDAETAIDALEEVGFSRNTIQVIDVNQTNDVYREKNRVIDETMLSGAIGGALWGGLICAAIGVGLLLLSGIEALGMGDFSNFWILFAIFGIISGALFGLMLGFFIGIGVSEEDSYVYEGSIDNGSTMILLQTNRRRATEASQIMYRVNALSLAS